MTEGVERFSARVETMDGTPTTEHSWPEMEPHPQGDWVRYSDYEKEKARADEASDLLDAERKDPGVVTRGEEFAAGLEAGRQQGAEEERERLRQEPARLAAFQKLTEGNYMSFTDPEGQEEYVWAIVDAVLDAALTDNQEAS